jgi:hypothetical protein
MFNTNLVQKGRLKKKKNKKKQTNKQIIVKKNLIQNHFKMCSNLSNLEIIVEILKYSDWGYRALFFLKNLTSCSHFCDYYFYYYVISIFLIPTSHSLWVSLWKLETNSQFLGV